LNIVNEFSHIIEILSATNASDFSYTAGRHEIEDLFKFIQEQGQTILKV
jgi:hypothetical protein